MVSEVLLLLFGFVVLVSGADALVRGASVIARTFGVSSLVIGLTVVAFGTSAPELFVSLQAAIDGTPDVAVGNVIGSNVFNILVIIGVSACLSPIKATRSVIRREMPIMLFSLLLFYLFAFDGSIERWEGAILFLGIISYLVMNYVLFRRQTESLEHLEDDAEIAARIVGRQPVVTRKIGLVALGLGGLVWGADLIVENASTIARHFNVSDLVIGITLVAVGTSLPELATTVVAAVRKEADLAVGNAVGSNIFNVFCVIGLTGMVTPLPVHPGALRVDMPFMVIACFLAWPLMAFRGRLGRKRGTLMLLGYTGYIVYIAMTAIEKSGG